MSYKPRFRGRAKQPFAQAIDNQRPNDRGLESTATSDSTLILSAIIVAAGVGYIYWRRNQSHTEPVVTVVPGYGADVSVAENMVNAVNAGAFHPYNLGGIHQFTVNDLGAG